MSSVLSTILGLQQQEQNRFDWASTPPTPQQTTQQIAAYSSMVNQSRDQARADEASEMRKEAHAWDMASRPIQQERLRLALELTKRENRIQEALEDTQIKNALLDQKSREVGIKAAEAGLVNTALQQQKLEEDINDARAFDAYVGMYNGDFIKAAEGLATSGLDARRQNYIRKQLAQHGAAQAWLNMQDRDALERNALVIWADQEGLSLPADPHTGAPDITPAIEVRRQKETELIKSRLDAIEAAGDFPQVKALRAALDSSPGMVFSKYGSVLPGFEERVANLEKTATAASLHTSRIKNDVRQPQESYQAQRAFISMINSLTREINDLEDRMKTSVLDEQETEEIKTQIGQLKQEREAYRQEIRRRSLPDPESAGLQKDQPQETADSALTKMGVAPEHQALYREFYDLFAALPDSGTRQSQAAYYARNPSLPVALKKGDQVRAVPAKAALQFLKEDPSIKFLGPASNFKPKTP